MQHAAAVVEVAEADPATVSLPGVWIGRFASAWCAVSPIGAYTFAQAAIQMAPSPGLTRLSRLVGVVDADDVGTLDLALPALRSGGT